MTKSKESYPKPDRSKTWLAQASRRADDPVEDVARGERILDDGRPAVFEDWYDGELETSFRTTFYSVIGVEGWSDDEHYTYLERNGLLADKTHPRSDVGSMKFPDCAGNEVWSVTIPICEGRMPGGNGEAVREPAFFLLPLDGSPPDPSLLEPERTGRPVAEGLLADSDEFRCESFVVSGPIARSDGLVPGDRVVQVTTEADGTVLVTGPGTVLHTVHSAVGDASHLIVFLRLPRRYRRKSLSAVLEELGPLGNVFEGLDGPTVLMGASDPVIHYLSQDELWVPSPGEPESPSSRDELADANRSAGRATAAWLTGEGLASATEKLRSRGGEETIPAPLLDQWRKMLLESATQAVQAADDVLAHVNGERRLGRERLAALADRGLSGAAEAERSCRAIARLALGVTSHMDGCEETARLERAAVLVLSSAGVRVEEEGVVFLGRERSELVTEAAGLLCWMLTQQRCGLVIGPPRTGRSALDVIVDGESNLLIRKNDEEQAWGAPVTVIEPARFIADFLSEHLDVPLDA